MAFVAHAFSPSATPAEPHVLRVLIASEYAMVRDALKAVVSTRANTTVIADAVNGRTALYKARHFQPDVLVIDATIVQAYGPNIAPQIRMLCPQTRILIVSALEENSYLQELFRLGISGYIWEQSTLDTFLQGIETVARGEKYLDPALTQAVMDAFLLKPKKGEAAEVSDAVSETTSSTDPSASTPPTTALSDRESGVLRRAALGYSGKEIAEQIGLSVKTVETYKTRAMVKLGLRNRVDIMGYAMRQGWFKKNDL